MGPPSEVLKFANKSLVEDNWFPFSKEKMGKKNVRLVNFVVQNHHSFVESDDTLDGV